MKTKDIAKQIIDKQVKGIDCLYPLIKTDVFKSVIDLIVSTKGKVIISGIGKSGHIGVKMAALLASTGTPSFFVHANEASHGDLGMIEKDDVVVIISNSGNTFELRDIIYYTKINKIKTVSIVSKDDSFLAENTDFSLVTGVIEEAMMNVPAPTTSTTVMMILGDVIAGCVSELKGFDKFLYNKFHPGGSLGKSLSHIGDVIRKTELPIVTPDSKMHDVILEITAKRLGIVAVVENGKICGVISDGDLRRHVEENGFFDKKAKDIMSHNPKTVYHRVFVTDVIALLHDNKILTALVVDDKNNFVGVAQLYDLI